MLDGLISRWRWHISSSLPRFWMPLNAIYFKDIQVFCLYKIVLNVLFLVSTGKVFALTSVNGYSVYWHLWWIFTEEPFLEL